MDNSYCEVLMNHDCSVSGCKEKPCKIFKMVGHGNMMLEAYVATIENYVKANLDFFSVMSKEEHIAIHIMVLVHLKIDAIHRILKLTIENKRLDAVTKFEEQFVKLFQSSLEHLLREYGVIIKS